MNSARRRDRYSSDWSTAELALVLALHVIALIVVGATSYYEWT